MNEEKDSNEKLDLDDLSKEDCSLISFAQRFAMIYPVKRQDGKVYMCQYDIRCMCLKMSTKTREEFVAHVLKNREYYQNIRGKAKGKGGENE